MAIQFNLHQGMKAKEIVKELRGKIAGESRMETVVLLMSWENNPIFQTDKLELKNRVEIVSDNGKYALLLEYKLHGGNIMSIFWLTGINDEGTYFLRPLEGIPEQTLRDFDKILSWLDKKDMGFTRIQGDILVGFIAEVNDHVHSKCASLPCFPDYKLSERKSFRLPPNDSHREWTDWYHMHAYAKQTNADRWGNGNRGINFGEHRITTDGLILTPNQERLFALEPLVIVGQQFVMKHPEHGTVTVEIPKDHYAVLVSQRGRDEIASRGTFD